MLKRHSLGCENCNPGDDAAERTCAASRLAVRTNTGTVKSVHQGYGDVENPFSTSPFHFARVVFYRTTFDSHTAKTSCSKRLPHYFNIRSRSDQRKPKPREELSDVAHNEGYTGGDVSRAKRSNGVACAGKDADRHVGGHRDCCIWADGYAQLLLQARGCGEVERARRGSQHRDG